MMMVSNKKSCRIKTRSETRRRDESLLPGALVEAGDGVEVDRGLEGKRLVAAQLSACELGFLVADDNRLGASGRGGGFRKKHHLAVLLEHDEVADGRFDRGTSRKDAVVLEYERAVLVAERLGNVVALLVGKHDAAKVLVERALVVEGAAVLRRDLDVPAKGREGLAVHRVRMTSGVKVGASSMDGVVDGKGSLVVDHPLGTTAIDDAAVGTDEQQVRDGHESERNAEGVDPEVVLEDGVSERQVAGDALLEAEVAEYTEGLSEPLLATLALGLERVVGGRLGEFEFGCALLHLLSAGLGGWDVVGSSRRRHGCESAAMAG